MASTKQPRACQANQQLWAAYTQTLKPLAGRRPLPVEPAAPPIGPEPPALPAKARLAAAQPVRPNAPPAGLDKSSWKKFATGKTRATRTLDLHGLTASRAHHATTDFIQRAHAEHLRVVEIITGKGEVLLRELPHWLNSPQLRPFILALAHPHAANTGSVRVLLKRTR